MANDENNRPYGDGQDDGANDTPDDTANGGANDTPDDTANDGASDTQDYTANDGASDTQDYTANDGASERGGSPEAAENSADAQNAAAASPPVTKSKRRGRAILTVSAVILSLFIGFFAARLMYGGPGGGAQGAGRAGVSAELVHSSAYAPEDVMEMEFMLLTTDVSFEASEDGNVLVEWRSSIDPEVQDPTVTLEGGRLSVSEYFNTEYNATMGLFKKERVVSAVTVYLPDDFHMERLSASIVAGSFSSLEYVALNVSEMSLTTISGGVTLPKVITRVLAADSISGDVFMALGGDAIEAIEVNTISGDCRLTLPEGCGMNISTSNISGKVEVSQSVLDTGASRRGVFSSVSGDLYIS